jgi:hypothetical protein
MMHWKAHRAFYRDSLYAAIAAVINEPDDPDFALVKSPNAPTPPDSIEARFIARSEAWQGDILANAKKAAQRASERRQAVATTAISPFKPRVLPNGRTATAQSRIDRMNQDLLDAMLAVDEQHDPIPFVPLRLSPTGTDDLPTIIYLEE